MEEAFDDFIDKFWKNDRVVELRQLAEEHRWEFTSRERFAEQPTELKRFKLFKGKRGKRITGIISTRHQQLKCDVRIYDYVYYSDGGKKRTSVVECSSPSFNIVPFRIYPKTRLANLFSFGTKTGLDKFFAEYDIEGPDPALLSRLPDSALCLVAEHPGLTVEADGDMFLYYYLKKRTPVQDLLDEYRSAVEILDKVLYDREKDFV